MKFIHIADVHLGMKPDRGRTWSDAREAEIEKTFKDVLTVCEEQQVDLLLIAGDLFDEEPSVNILKQIDYQFSRIPQTKVAIIAGSSDYISEGHSYWQHFKFSPNVLLFPREKAANVYLQDINCCITGYSYGKAEYTERILEKMKPGKEGAYNILLGYGGDRNHMPFSKSKLEDAGYDYIALGHIHKPSHIVKDKMAFAGSLEPLDYTETGRHGYIMGEVNGEGKTTITFVPFAKRSYVNMAIEISPNFSNADIMSAVKEQIEKVGRRNIYRILVKGVINNDVDLNLSSLVRQYNINEIIDNTKKSYDMEELIYSNQNNLFGRFYDKLSGNDETETDEECAKALEYGINAMLNITR